MRILNVIDPATETILRTILHRESLSLLSYISDAYPWTTAEQAPGLITLRKLIQQEKNAITSFGRFLVRQKITPPVNTSFPAEFTSYNFVALSFLLPHLLEAQKQLIAQMQADLAKIADPACRREVERLLAVKKMTLAGLESLESPPAPRASA